MRGVKGSAAGYRHHRPARQQNRPQRKKSQKATDQWPFQNIEAPRNLLHGYRPRDHTAAFLRPRTLIGVPTSALKRRRAGDVESELTIRRQAVAPVKVHSLFLATGL